jgi:RNA polymerase sigma-B factor
MQEAARTRLIEEHLPLVRTVAAAYARRGEPFEDLVQVGTIGLIGAVDAFEDERGCPFGAYAVTRIRGEIRRHLRDRAAPVRVPRRVQAQGAVLRRADRDLAARLGRAPRVAELAAACGLRDDEAGRALAAGHLRATLPLGGTADADELASAAGGALTCSDFSAAADERAAVAWALRRLPARDRRLLRLRFFADLSQAEAGRVLGLSQVHVSRLERAALARLREALEADGTYVASVVPPGVGS